jgi:hypothetical protein
MMKGVDRVVALVVGVGTRVLFSSVLKASDSERGGVGSNCRSPNTRCFVNEEKSDCCELLVSLQGAAIQWVSTWTG